MSRKTYTIVNNERVPNKDHQTRMAIRRKKQLARKTNRLPPGFSLSSKKYPYDSKKRKSNPNLGWKPAV